MKIADSFSLAPCPDPRCTALHLISCDDCGQPLVMTAISIEAMNEVIEVMRDHLYAVAALKGGGDQ